MNNSLIEPPFIPAWAKSNKENIFFIYNGASMAPLFKPGDMLCSCIPVWEKIRPGDVVIIHRGNYFNHSEHIVHRVVSINKDTLVTKGDNNSKPDDNMVTVDNLIGLITSVSRRGHLHPVSGRTSGLFYARLIHARNQIWLFIKRLGGRAYRRIWQSRLVSRVWHPAINQIRLMTDEGLLIKYCFNGRTVARWWPQQKRFQVMKPFDLVLSDPDEPG